MVFNVKSGEYLPSVVCQGFHVYSDVVIDIKVKFLPARGEPTPLKVVKIYEYPRIRNAFHTELSRIDNAFSIGEGWFTIVGMPKILSEFELQPD
jgi:hypothetical protein